MGVADPSRETGVVCACACPCGIETAVAFFRSYVPGLETAIAFADENRLVLACFSVAVVLSVSTVAVRGRALVTAVSCWPGSAVAEVSMVSKSLRRRVRCVKKFALRAQNTPNLTFLRLLGEFCRGLSGGEGVLGELCRACRPATTSGPGSATGPVPAAILCGASAPTTSASVGVLQHWELASGVSSACRGSNDVISPCGSSEVTVRGQSADPLGEDAENGVLWARWSVFWAQRHLVWSVARMWAPEYAGCPLDSHVNPLYRT